MKNLFFVIIISLTFFINLSYSYAQEPSDSSATASATVDYPLPYPGILPDNPLYFMKALRDRVVSFFISDPFKQAEFNLLMADVRLNAAQYLFAKGESKYSLAETTISKGENYFYKSLVMVSNAKQQGVSLNDFVPKLITAAKKHEQVIKDMEVKSPPFIKGRLVEDEKRTKDFEIRAMQIKLN
jgi:hypothetical protein